MTLSPNLRAVLDRALEAPSPYFCAVATDADGTLWNTDVGDALFLRVAARDDFSPEGLDLLRTYAREWLTPSAAEGTGKAIAEALFAKYSAGELDVRVMCDLEAATIAGRPLAELRDLFGAIARESAPRVRTNVRALLHEAARAGATIRVVSASLAMLVEATLREADIPFDAVWGTTLEIRDDFVHARIAQTSPVYEGKVNALRQMGEWPAALGLGDGGWDHTFLREVHVPLLIEPKQALIDAMRDVPRAIVLTE